jgi:hypothetical protein
MICAPPVMISSPPTRQRIVPTAIVEKFATGVDGELVPLTPGNTMPVALTVTHAAICKVQR